METAWRPRGDRVEIIHSYYRVAQLSPINRVHMDLIVDSVRRFPLDRN
jgi:hypothetical protein